jgi:hypothetical protein
MRSILVRTGPFSFLDEKCASWQKNKTLKEEKSDGLYLIGFLGISPVNRMAAQSSNKKN